MALLFADDFKGYGTDVTLLLNGIYAEIGNSSLTTDPDPSASGPVFQTSVNALNGTRMRRVLPAAVTTAGFACRVWMNSLPSATANTLGFGFSDNANLKQFDLTVDTTGRIVIRNGSVFATIIGQTTGPVLTANAWNHIELKAVASATVGTIDVRVNGVPVLAITGANTGLQYSQFRLDNLTSTGTTTLWYMKDFAVWNSSGSFNNTFLGTVTVLGLVPTSDVTLGGWTVSTGTTGFNLLDNSPPLDGTEYISSAVPPTTAAQFNLADVPANVTSVRALITQVRAAKIDGGDGNIQASLISGASTANGADRPITTAFTYYEDVFEVDPATSAAWTPAAANAAKFKINRTV